LIYKVVGDPIFAIKPAGLYGFFDEWFQSGDEQCRLGDECSIGSFAEFTNFDNQKDR